jgi:hypothetical protein
MRRFVSALVIVCSLALAKPVFAQVLDQALVPPGAESAGFGTCTDRGQTLSLAQTFTAGISGRLTAVQLPLVQRGGDDPPLSWRMQVAIFSATNGAPASGIQTLTFTIGNLPIGGRPQSQFRFEDFPGFSVPVTAGQSYAIVVSVLDAPFPTTGLVSTVPGWVVDVGASYAGGRSFRSALSCPGQSQQWFPTNGDFGFRTFVIPASAGTPSPPTGINASQSNPSTLSVTWTPPAIGPVPEGYRLDFFSSGAPVAQVLVGPGGSVSLPIPPGTVGNFVVTVSSRIGGSFSVPSSPAAFSLGSSPCAALPAPSGLTGSVTSGTGRVQWNAVPGATSYIVSAGSSPGASDLFNGDVGNVTSVVAAGLPAGFRAFVRVFAVGLCGRSEASVEFELR